MATPWFMYHVNKGYGSYGGKFHDGWDFGAPSKTPLITLTGGVATKHTGWYPWGGEVDIKGGVLGPGVTETFAHADRLDVKPGDTVTPGTQVGLSGGEGLPHQYSTGPHVHYSLFGGAPWDNRYAIDPGGFLNKTIKNFGIGNAFDSTGGDMTQAAIALGEKLGAIEEEAKAATGRALKRVGYFIIGALLVVLGILLLTTSIGASLGRKLLPGLLPGGVASA